MTGDTSAAGRDLRVRPHDSLTFETLVDDATGESTVVAQVDGRDVGECEAWRPPTHFSESPDYSRWVTIEWLGVDQRHRTRGIGRALLIEQLKQQRRRGVERVIAWIEVGNQPVRELLTSAGFASGPECHTMWSDIG
ncbi:MAG: N-acetyltransferase family protein [Actinomycetota bacterium]